MTTYDVMSQFYDLEYAEFEDDLPLYLELAGRTGSPVLDVGAGTGRVTLALARAGFRVTGIDESGAMLACARAKLSGGQALSRQIECVQSTAAEFNGGGRFRLAIVALNSFRHLLTQQDQLSTLLNLRRCLTPGGVCAIDIDNPDPATLIQNNGLLVLHWEKANPSTGQFVQKWLTYETDRGTQIQDYTLIYDAIDPDGTLHRTRVAMPLRYTYRYEAQLLLECAGFAVEEVFGSYQRDPYEGDSERMILIAVAR
jgi:ubiquinone/menaquinone biosynthesis C-methylase UbiE